MTTQITVVESGHVVITSVNKAKENRYCAHPDSVDGRSIDWRSNDIVGRGHTPRDAANEAARLAIEELR